MSEFTRYPILSGMALGFALIALYFAVWALTIVIYG